MLLRGGARTTRTRVQVGVGPGNEATRLSSHNYSQLAKHARWACAHAWLQIAGVHIPESAGHGHRAAPSSPPHLIDRKEEGLSPGAILL